jgi:putative SOS response-associated peptidase YedK
MCARYTLATPARLLQRFPKLRFPQLVPRYNIAPSTPVVGVRNTGKAQAEFFTWGPRLINARSETLASKPSFSQALRLRRGLVFADGYYEWLDASGVRKQPYLLTRADGAPFAFAALWEELPTPGDGPRYGCALVTMPAADDIAWLHHRMPVILNDAGCEQWLDPSELHVGNEHGVLAQIIDEPLVATAVSRAVNKTWRDDDPALLTPVTPPIQDSFF